MRLTDPSLRVRALLLRLALFALLWWVLTEGRPDAWLIGGLVVFAASGLSLILSRPTPWSAIGLARFLPFFLLRSWRGGLDVAWRACWPSLPIAPVIMSYRLRLPPGRARVFMTAVVSLLPGTLSAELARNRLHIHVLDGRAPILNDLADLETRVAAIFRIDLAAAQRSNDLVSPDAVPCVDRSGRMRSRVQRS